MSGDSSSSSSGQREETALRLVRGGEDEYRSVKDGSERGYSRSGVRG